MLWVKAFHIIFVVCWFAMLFYLPRLFIYHSTAKDEISIERFKLMERRLLRIIGNPCMTAALVFGCWMAWDGWEYYSSSTWFWLKMFLVILLVVYHHICVRFFKKFLRDEIPASTKFLRWFNEFPTLILFAVVLLVVVKQPL